MRRQRTEERSYYGYNLHSDVETLTDSNGQTVGTYGYTAYGKDDKTLFTGADKPDPNNPDAEPYNVYRFNGNEESPEKAWPSWGRPVGDDPELYKPRNTVGRAFNVFKNWRGIATRYDKLAQTFRAGIMLATIYIWLSALGDTP